MMRDPDRFHRHRFPAEIIGRAVWLYYTISLSLRDVELLLAETWQPKQTSARQGSRRDFAKPNAAPRGEDIGSACMPPGSACAWRRRLEASGTPWKIWTVEVFAAEAGRRLGGSGR